MEIAALPSCEKSLFADAKVAIFLQMIHPGGFHWADVCVLVLPCGRSAHTEAGWFAGKGLKTIVYMPEKQEPELMYKLFDGVVDNLNDLLRNI